MSGARELAHRLEGEGAPVVLLNGGMMTMASWDPVATRLILDHRVLRCDFRGQLLSPGDAPPTLAGHAADVEALLDRVGWESTHLIGASFGATVAVELAARCPARVRSLVAITAMDRETPEFRAGSDDMRAVLASILKGGGRARCHDLLVESVYSAGYRRAEAAALAARRAQIEKLPAAWFAGVDRLLAALEGFDLGPSLARVRAPALALVAADDRVMSAERSAALAAALGAELETHPTSGHALVVEDPHWLIERCLRFLARHDGAAGVDRATPAGSPAA